MEMENLVKFNYLICETLDKSTMKKTLNFGILWVDFMHIWILNFKGLF